MASYTYLPWVRQGLISAAGAATAQGGRLGLDVSATFTGGAGGTSQPVTIRLFGPGDVTSLSPSQVLRTDPPNLTSDFEPNYFPLVEFDRPDLPWIFTPAAPGADGRLQPWLCLVVAEQREGVTLDTSDATALPVLSIESGAHRELPDLAEAWAWAHAQVSAVSGPDDLRQALAGEPQRALSRLVCPRRLQAGTAYQACVVPTYLGGVQAGLGGSVDDDTALQPAWTLTADAPDAIRLPVYYHFQFATGAQGDFESLVWQLQRRQLTFADVGTRPLDIGQTGYGLPAGERADLQGALAPLATDGDAVLAGPSPDYRLRLQSLVNGSSIPPVPVLPPPIYGRWHAAQRSIPDVTATGQPRDRPWLRSLNLDPRNRVAAGLGAAVVRDQQEQLMASAWDQVGDIERANQLVRHAQLARAASRKIHERRLPGLDPATFLLVSGPVQARVTYRAASSGTDATALGHLRASILPRAVASAQLRRMVRPRGPVARRFRLAGAARRAGMVDGLNAHAIGAAPAAWPAPDGMQTMESLLDRGPCGVDADKLAAALVERYPLEKLTATLAAALAAFQQAGPQLAALGAGARALIEAAFKGLRRARALLDAYRAQVAAAGGRLTVAAVAGPYRTAITEIAQAETPFAQAKAQAGLPEPAVVAGLEAALAALPHDDGLRLLQFGLAALLVLADVEPCEAPPPAYSPPLDLGELQGAVLAKTDPAVTIAARLASRIEAPGWNAAELDTVMAAPVFPTPMYTALAARSADWLLPGLDRIPPNTLTLMESNTPFIEAFMVGLNHEMSRELLWRGYPTDQRGSYFRQFWDPSGRFPPPTTDAERAANLEAGRDIPPINEWKDRDLGDNFGRPSAGAVGGGDGSGGPGAGQTILLMRGDLLRRYPHASIYAVQAAWSVDPDTGVKHGPRNLTATEQHPVFRGELLPDISFLGFALDPATARGTDAPSTGPAGDGAGWFIVIEQQPTASRYGLDETAPASDPAGWTWRDLAWPHVGLTEPGGCVRVGAGLDASFPAGARRGPTGEAWQWDAASSDSAQLACITLQGPVRVAIHASDLL
jgi:hypothetical protein